MGVEVELAVVPVAFDDGPEFLVEGERGGVPVEDLPVEAGGAQLAGALGRLPEQFVAESLPAVLGLNIEVFEVGGASLPSGVDGKEEGHADDLVVDGGDQQFESLVEEEILAELFGVIDHFLRGPFVLGELVDQTHHGGQVFLASGADGGVGRQGGRHAPSGVARQQGSQGELREWDEPLVGESVGGAGVAEGEGIG